MKILILHNLTFLVLFMLFSCAKHEKPYSMKHKPVRIETKVNNSLGLKNFNVYSSSPDAFTVFFIPTEEQIGRIGYKDKIKNIYKNIITYSNAHDELDEEINDLSNELLVISKNIEVNCADETTTNKDYCEKQNASMYEIFGKLDTLTIAKSEEIRKIQSEVDVNIQEPVNWQDVKDANQTRFEFSRVTGTKLDLEIFINDLGAFEQKYMMRDGSIFDIEIKENKRNKNILNILFKIKEKNKFKEFTGNIFEFDLEVSEFINKLRLKGDVFKVKDGVKIQEGICKIDFPRI